MNRFFEGRPSRNWLLAGLLVLLAGCGSDGGTQRTTVSTTPLNGATGIAAVEEIQLKVTGPIDQASLAEASVSYEGGSAPVPGKATYDAQAGVVKVTPLRRLDNGETYQLTISGVKDGAGTLLPPTVVSFSTNRNAVSKEYDYASMYGHLYYVVVTAYDAQGRTIQMAQTYNPGSDQSWGTGDDPYTFNIVWDYSASGAEGRRTYYSSPGADGVWMTADDKAQTSNLHAYDERGKVIRDLYYTGPGPDGVWFTADDPVYSGMTYSYDAKGNITRAMNLNGAGADGIWFTADDATYAYTETTYAPDGSWRRSVGYMGSGVDRKWFTPDDFSISEGYTTYERDAMGNIIREVTDRLSINVTNRTSTTYAYDGKGNLLRSITYNGAGPDGTWFTGDDKVYSYSDTTYNAKGDRTLRLTYHEPGADGLWFTADDNVTSRKEFDTTH